MKFKRISSAVMAAVMAASTAIVFEMPASAAETNLLTSSVTINSSNTIASDGNIQIDLITGQSYNAEDYDSITITYDVNTVGETGNFQLYNDIGGWDSTGEWGVTAGTVKKLTLDLSSKTGTFTKIGVQLNCGSENANKAFTGDITISSLVLNPKTSKEPFTTVYDGSAITLKKEADGGIKGEISIDVDNITTGTSTIADLQAAYSNINMTGVKYVSDSLGLSASDFQCVLVVQSGADWSGWSTGTYTTLTDSEQTVSLGTSSITVPDTNVIQKILVQFFVNGSPAAAADLATGDTITINPKTVAATDITIDTPSSYAYNINDTVTLTATVAPADATDKTITWSSSNTSVATVDSTGKVTFVGSGKVTITATCGEKTATVDFSVYGESKTDYTAASTTTPTKITLKDGSEIWVMPISKADVKKYDAVKVTVTSGSKSRIYVLNSVYKSFKFVDNSGNAYQETGKDGVYFAIIKFDGVPSSYNVEFQLINEVG